MRKQRASGAPGLRVLGHYVRELTVMTWQEAVRKMTPLPATTIGMVDRGAIAPGMAADVTVFDPATVIDHATYEQPALASEGIRHVLVNGVPVLRDGKPTGERAGRVLRRDRHMPSRPLNTDRSRRLKVAGTVTPVDGRTGSMQVSIDLSQRAEDARARGTLRLREQNGRTIDSRDIGVLQISDRWASVTAAVRLGTGYRPLVVIVDDADPQRVERKPRLRIAIDGVAEATGHPASPDIRIGRR